MSAVRRYACSVSRAADVGAFLHERLAAATAEAAPTAPPPRVSAFSGGGGDGGMHNRMGGGGGGARTRTQLAHQKSEAALVREGASTVAAGAGAAGVDRTVSVDGAGPPAARRNLRAVAARSIATVREAGAWSRRRMIGSEGYASSGPGSRLTPLAASVARAAEARRLSMGAMAGSSGGGGGSGGNNLRTQAYAALAEARTALHTELPAALASALASVAYVVGALLSSEMLTLRVALVVWAALGAVICGGGGDDARGEPLAVCAAPWPLDATDPALVLRALVLLPFWGCALAVPVLAAAAAMAPTSVLLLASWRLATRGGGGGGGDGGMHNRIGGGGGGEPADAASAADVRSHGASLRAVLAALADDKCVRHAGARCGAGDAAGAPAVALWLAGAEAVGVAALAAALALAAVALRWWRGAREERCVRGASGGGRSERRPRGARAQGCSALRRVRPGGHRCGCGWRWAGADVVWCARARALVPHRPRAAPVVRTAGRGRAARALPRRGRALHAAAVHERELGSRSARACCVCAGVGSCIR